MWKSVGRKSREQSETRVKVCEIISERDSLSEEASIPCVTGRRAYVSVRW